jgi:hypothetical protein
VIGVGRFRENALAKLFQHRGPTERTVDGHQSRKAHTVNVDYLLSLERTDSERAWVFLELKTDAASFKENQAALYLAARERGMGGLLEDILFVSTRPSAPEAKYERLRASLPSPDVAPSPILVVYLGPTSAQGAATRWVDAAGRHLDRYFTLTEFAGMPLDWIGPEHRDLWPPVSKFLRMLDERRLRAGTSP